MKVLLANSWEIDGVCGEQRTYPSKTPDRPAQVACDVSGLGFQVRFYIDKTPEQEPTLKLLENSKTKGEVVRVKGTFGRDAKLNLVSVAAAV